MRARFGFNLHAIGLIAHDLDNTLPHLEQNVA
jgi:hypothetical protein